MPDAPFPRGYAICSEHRSGSTLLCRLLASTGKLGRPDEFFRHTEFSHRLEREPALLAEVRARASTPNGVYGIKLFTQQFDVTAKARWTERLPGLFFVHLERRDLLGQAISLARALQTEQYVAEEASRREPRYDRRLIARHLGRIADGHARWRRFFARNGIEPVWLVYEELVADPQAAVDAIARRAMLREPAPIAPGVLGMAVQRDRLSEEWRARFVAKAGDLGYLDHPLGRSRVWLRRLARDVGHRGRALSGRR